MALIECPNCKKPVSNLREECIHCGVPLDVKLGSNDLTFFMLNARTRVDYELKFLCENKRAMAFRRKGIEINKVLKTGRWLLLSGLVVFYAGFMLKTPGVANVYFVSAIFLGLLQVLLSLIIEGIFLIRKRLYRRSTRYYVYLKSFGQWLKSKYDIQYVPSLKGERQRQKYQSIDIDKSKL